MNEWVIDVDCIRSVYQQTIAYCYIHKTGDFSKITSNIFYEETIFFFYSSNIIIIFGGSNRSRTNQNSINKRSVLKKNETLFFSINRKIYYLFEKSLNNKKPLSIGMCDDGDDGDDVDDGYKKCIRKRGNGFVFKYQDIYSEKHKTRWFSLHLFCRINHKNVCFTVLHKRPVSFSLFRFFFLVWFWL